MYIFSSGLDSLFVNLIGMMYQHLDWCRCVSSMLVCGPGVHRGTCIRYVALLSLRLIRLRGRYPCCEKKVTWTLFDSLRRFLYVT